MNTCITSSRAPLLAAALAAALALPRAAAGQNDSASSPPAPPAPSAVEAPPVSPPAPAAAGATPVSPQVRSTSTSTPARTQAGEGAAGGERMRRPAASGSDGEKGTPRPAGGPPRPAAGGATAGATSGPAPSLTETATAPAPGADATAATTEPPSPGSGGAQATPDRPGSTSGGERSWLAGAAVAVLALLLAGQVAVIVLLRRIGREARIFAARLNIRGRQMTTQPEPAPPGPGPVVAEHRSDQPLAPVPHGDAGRESSAASGATAPDAGPDHGSMQRTAASADEQGNGAPGGETALPAGGGDGAGGTRPGVVPQVAGVAENGAGREGERDPSGQAADASGGVPPAPARRRRARAGVRLHLPRRAARGAGRVPPPWPGGSHALYARARARLAVLQEERGEKDRARLSAAAARFERRRAWILALHGAWENDVEFAYLDLLQKPGAGAVKDPYVMVYPVSEHDWTATRDELRRLAAHIGALPEEGHPHWPALLPRTALRSSVDFDLRVQPPQGATPAAEFHARRLLATLLVNFKSLQRARMELGRLVQWVVEAAPAADARPADVSPHALAILDAVCAAGTPAAQREAAVDAAVAEMDTVDEGNFAAVRAAEGHAEALEQRYHAFLKVLFRVVDGNDRARALHAGVMAGGAADDPWLAGWGAILDEMDCLLVERVLGARLEIEPIACGQGDALDIDLHNPLGAEPVQGVEKDQVWRVESRGFAYAEDGARRVVRPVDVIVAVPAS